jgi:hypothetical protein
MGVEGAYTDTGMIRRYATVAEDVRDELAGLAEALDAAELPADFWPAPGALEQWNAEASQHDSLMRRWEGMKDKLPGMSGHPVRDALIDLGAAYEQAHASVVARLNGYSAIYKVIAYNLRTAADNYDQAES